VQSIHAAVDASVGGGALLASLATDQRRTDRLQTPDRTAQSTPTFPSGFGLGFGDEGLGPILETSEEDLSKTTELAKILYEKVAIMLIFETS